MPSPEFLLARNRQLLADAVNGGQPLYVPPCEKGHKRSVTRDATALGGWRIYCNACRKERRRENGVVPRESDAFRRKMRRARLEVLERKKEQVTPDADAIERIRDAVERETDAA